MVQVVLSAFDRLVLQAVSYTANAFLVLPLVNLLGGRPARLLVYHSRSLILYTLFRNSFSFFLVVYFFGFFGYISSNAIFSASLLRIFILAAVSIYLACLVLFTIKIIFWGGVLWWSRIKEVASRYSKSCLMELLRLSVLAMFFISVYIAFFYTDLGLKIFNTVLRVTIVPICLFIVPLFLFSNIYLPRRRTWRYLIKGASALLSKTTEHYRYCFIINGQDRPGRYSDIMNLSPIRQILGFLRPGVRRLEVPQLSDAFDRIKAYTDYDEKIDIWMDEEPDDEKDLRETREDEEVTWFFRSTSRFINIFMQPELFLLDSADYSVMKSNWKNETSFNKTFVRRLDSVYLMVGTKTSNRDLELFRKLLGHKNVLSGVVLITEQQAGHRFEGELANMRGIKIIELQNRRPKDVIKAVGSFETSRLKNRLYGRSALDELAEMEATKAKVEGIVAEQAEGDIDEQLMNERIRETIEKHQEALEQSIFFPEQKKARKTQGEVLQNRLIPEFGRPYDPLKQIPDSVAFFGYRPAKDLIRGLVNENNYSTRVYIIFNLLEMLAKTMVFARLSWLPSDHPEVTEFPNSVTGLIGTRGKITDYADDVNYLYRFATKRDEDARDLSEHLLLLRAQLIKPIQVPVGEHLERLRTFFPFLIDLDIVSLAELLPYTSFLRNQIRGHGVVTNFVAAIAYPVVLNYLDRVCTAVDELRLNARRTGNGMVVLQIGEVSTSCRNFMQYDKSLNDYIFLEGYRKGKPLYIAYTAGKKYKLSVTKI